jgi:hypothetical protein
MSHPRSTCRHAGDEFTVADIAAGHTLLWAKSARIFPQCGAGDYLETLQRRPAFERAQAKCAAYIQVRLNETSQRALQHAEQQQHNQCPNDGYDDRSKAAQPVREEDKHRLTGWLPSARRPTSRRRCCVVGAIVTAT